MNLTGIDGNEANRSSRVGIGRYAHELLLQFYRLQTSDCRIRVYLKNPPKSHMPEEKESWRYKIARPKYLWTQIGLPLQLFLENEAPDVFFSPTHYAPRFAPCPRVISIMDLAYLRYPELFTGKDIHQLKSWTKYSIKKAERIITISRASKADIIKYYDVNARKIDVVYPGVTMKVKSKEQRVKDILDKYGVEGEYILFVGTLQPRKNLLRLLEAFSRVKSQKSKVNCQLVIAGKKGWMYEDIFARVKELDLTEEVVFTGFVPEDELPTFYQAAKCLVLVSLYEGFGLPVAEAMHYGKPVVVSDTSSLPEVAGSAGIYVDPENIQDIADGLLKILALDESEYAKLSEKSKEQASKFSWEKSAIRVLQILEEVGGGDNA